ncbi:MAG: division/cell wall cluster transcriptional repressor MraZ [Chloroflexota bacterium]
MQVGPLSFFGEQEHRVDPQGRISLPARFRDAFKGGIVLTRGYDRCIAAYTPVHWETFASQVATLALNRAKNRRMRRMSFSSAYQLEIDRQGRVLLPASLRQYAQIGEEVVIAGMGDFLEIWDKEAWLQESALLDEEASLIAETSEEHP